MTRNTSRFEIAPPTYAAHELNRFQVDLVQTARKWAVEEVSAAMVHQLNEPLTALLLYLNEIKQEGEYPAGVKVVPNSMQELVERALHETERVCDIMARAGHTVEVPVDVGAAVARGRAAIDSLTRTHSAEVYGEATTATPHSGRHDLTERELEVLAQITEGASNKGGAHRLGISQRTFEAHRARIMGKLGAKNAADLVRIALSEIK